MLIKVKYLDYDKPCAYAPPQEDAILNTDDVVSAVPTEARGSGPFLRVNLRDGTSITIVGTPDTLLAGQADPSAQEREACAAMVVRFTDWESCECDECRGNPRGAHVSPDRSLANLAEQIRARGGRP